MVEITLYYPVIQYYRNAIQELEKVVDVYKDNAVVNMINADGLWEVAGQCLVRLKAELAFVEENGWRSIVDHNGNVSK